MRFTRRSLLAAIPGLPLACAVAPGEEGDAGASPEAVIFANGRFVAVGRSSGGVAWTSTDGQRFEAAALPAAPSALCFGAGRFVAIAEGSADFATAPALLWSADGRVWNEEATPMPLSSIAAGNDRFVALSPAAGAAVVSTDGVTWRQVAFPAEGVRQVVFGQGLFVAYGEGDAIALSADGLTWKQRELRGVPPLETVACIRFANGSFLGTTTHRPGAQRVRQPPGRLESPDGVTWIVTTARSLTGEPVSGAPNIRDLAARGARLVSVQPHGLYSSDDGGKGWTLRHADATSTAVAAGPAGFVAVAEGALLTSADGERWRMQRPPLAARARRA